MANTRKATGPRPKLTLAQVTAKIQRTQRTVQLVLDAEAAAEVEQLTELLEQTVARDAVSGQDPVAPAVAKELQAAEDRAAASTVPFTMVAISHIDYRALVDAHPASTEQIAEQRTADGEVWPFDADAFAPALVHAQLVDPDPGDYEDFETFWNGLSDGQLQRLWLTAIGVQMRSAGPGPRSALAVEVLRAVAE